MPSERSIVIPRDRHYDRDHHIWAAHDPDSGKVRVGIDALGLESLGELAYVTLSDTGTRVARGSTMGSLEAAKMTTTIAAPVTGTITARNEEVLSRPSLVNEAPYDGGWLVEIEPAMWDADAAELVSDDDLESWVAAEVARLDSEDQAR